MGSQKLRILFPVAVLFFSVILNEVKAEQPEINTILMNATFKIDGPSRFKGQKSTGTVFLLGKPKKDDPLRYNFVLVTAKHVLRDIEGPTATLYFRERIDDGFGKISFEIKIRDKGKPLWTAHPTEDVATMYIVVPKSAYFKLLPYDFLITENEMKKWEIHPGDTLYTLGFPFGLESNDAGFPILRSGEIASYPLTPTSKVKTFLIDLQVFGGNSGGPVYLVESSRYYGGSFHVGQTIMRLMGLISKQSGYTEEILLPSNSTTSVKISTIAVSHTMAVAHVVHASIIRETIERMPPNPFK